VDDGLISLEVPFRDVANVLDDLADSGQFAVECALPKEVAVESADLEAFGEEERNQAGSDVTFVTCNQYTHDAC
jgi:hypothetical protein